MAKTFPVLVRTAFGLEAVVNRELAALGYEDTSIEDGRILFKGSKEDIVRCNLWLRSAERVQVQLGRFRAVDFGELFDRTTALPWADWIPADGEFPVTGRCVRSKLRSVRNCQKIVKKAIVESLKAAHSESRLPETGALFPVEISMLKDDAILTLDTTGSGLHKRGYRHFVASAPIKETLAAAIIQLSFWNQDRPLWDPLCGSGTLPIEAALIATNRAPGLHREFLSESWECIPKAIFGDLRRDARSRIDDSPFERIMATDQDVRILRRAREHAEAAGVSEHIHFQQLPLKEVSSAKKFGCLVANPPYGERLGKEDEVELLYRQMATLLKDLESWSSFIITSNLSFEKIMRRKADRRRKLYNGKIACTLYQYHGPRPPRRSHSGDKTNSRSDVTSEQPTSESNSGGPSNQQ